MVQPFDYLLESHVSLQWRGMLTALAGEFEAQIGPAELRQLMHRVGSRFAATHPLPACDSSADLADALNRLWREMAWGYVTLSDEPDSLRIVHHCAPLQAFGDAALDWTPALLEGAYQTWLSALGAEGLSVAQTSAYGNDAAIEFRLARHPGR